MSENTDFQPGKLNIAPARYTSEWIRFDFTNPKDFMRTIPAYVAIGDATITGKTWAKILAAVVEHEINAKNPALAVLYKRPLSSSNNGKPFFLKNKIKKLNCARLSNNYWINVNRDIPALMKIVLSFCLYCGYSEEQIVIYGIKKDKSREAINGNAIAVDKGNTQNSLDEAIRLRAEDVVLQSELKGISVTDLARTLSSSEWNVAKIVRASTKIVSIGDRLIHEDSFSEWEEGARQMDDILTKLMAKNAGYVSCSQLYEYARAEMDLFLHENDMADQRKIFDIAEHLFDKKGYQGKHYTFCNKTHISQNQEKIASKLDIMKKYAHDHQGFFRQEDLGNYLQGLGIQTASLRQQMKVYDEPIFLLYEPGVFITKDSMGIDEEWLQKTSGAFRKLFDDSGDHVVFRDIDSYWYTLLPELPNGKEWTLLLLQSVLMHYGGDIDAKVIRASVNQRLDTLGAMVASISSEIQTFADAVISVILDDGIDERRFESEELRQLLVKRGLIAGSELIWNMPKVLPNDEHFVWDAEGKYVALRI